MSPRTLLVLALLAVGNIGIARAGDCCAHCGCRSNVCAVCRPVCDTKEVKETVYTVECEDFCVPGRSIPTDCCPHGCQGGCEHKCFKPACGRVRTRRVLVKKEITKKVPITKCVVVYMCPQCSASCGCSAVPGEAAPANAPKPTAALPLDYSRGMAMIPAPDGAYMANAPVPTTRR